MTSIGTLIVKGKSAETSHIVCVADGQGTAGNIKAHQERKLVLAGNRQYIIMGSGPARHILDVERKVENETYDSVHELADAVVEGTQEIDFEKDGGLGFIVAGPDGEGGLASVGIECSDKFQFGIKGVHFEGSAKPHVINYFRGAQDSGKNLYPSTPAEAMTLALDFSHKGARDIGVDDKLQYGIITPNGISVLYHPRIGLPQDEYEAYVKQLFGIEAQRSAHKTVASRTEAQARSMDIASSLARIYSTIEQDLQLDVIMRRSYTFAAEQWANDEIALGDLRNMKRQREEAHARVKAGVNALLTGPEALLAYVDAQAQRQQTAHHGILMPTTD